MDVTLNALSPVTDINAVVNFVNTYGAGMVAPELFYSRQLLDTIREGADQYVYYRLATTNPIGDKADKLVLRRWSPLKAHTTPLQEGIPPLSDKGTIEKYEISTAQYGRYMEFSDKVNFKMIDPVLALYSKEYSIVAVETLDMLARETLMALANPYYSDLAVGFENLTVTSGPALADLRMIILHLQRQMVKPRMGNFYEVIGSPEFFFDMVTDATVEKYMTINNTTSTVYSNSEIPPMFKMSFSETLVVPESGQFTKLVNDVPTKSLRLYRAVTVDATGAVTYEYRTIDTTTDDGAGNLIYSLVSGYVKDSRTNEDASYLVGQDNWDLDAYNDSVRVADAPDAGSTATDWAEFKVQHILVLGADCLVRTGISGQDSAKMFTKPLGSSGVLDPIDQRQSIGFKINDVGFGSSRTEAIIDYMCVPSSLVLL
jgi:hypothetical protein